MRKVYVLAALATVTLLSGCVTQKQQPVGLANPAAVYCVEHEGQLDTVTEEGKRVTYCVLPDGRRIEEWQYFRENHPQEDSEGM